MSILLSEEHVGKVLSGRVRGTLTQTDYTAAFSSSKGSSDVSTWTKLKRRGGAREDSSRVHDRPASTRSR